MRGKAKYIPSSLVTIASKHYSESRNYLKSKLWKSYERGTWTTYVVGRE